MVEGARGGGGGAVFAAATASVASDDDNGLIDSYWGQLGTVRLKAASSRFITNSIPEEIHSLHGWTRVDVPAVLSLDMKDGRPDNDKGDQQGAQQPHQRYQCPHHTSQLRLVTPPPARAFLRNEAAHARACDGVRPM